MSRQKQNPGRKTNVSLDRQKIPMTDIQTKSKVKDKRKDKNDFYSRQRPMQKKDIFKIMKQAKTLVLTV